MEQKWTGVFTHAMAVQQLHYFHAKILRKSNVKAATKQTRPFLSGSFHFGGFTDMVSTVDT